MNDSYRKLSRVDYAPAEKTALTEHALIVGAALRIADATELMAKRNQELVNAKEAAESSKRYWQDCADKAERRLNASKGQITKLRKQLAALKTEAA